MGRVFAIGIVALFCVGCSSGSSAAPGAAPPVVTGDEQLDGTAGNDVLTTGNGNDTVRGFGGDDVISTGSGQDSLEGGDGNDMLEGGSGADVIDGGAGIDTVSYVNSNNRVEVDLEEPTQRRSDANGDVLVGIENVIGTPFRDLITGDAGDNVLDGGDREDAIAGGAGNDTLIGGPFPDTLVGGPGEDTVSYETSEAGVTVDLTLPVQFGSGDESGDQISGVQNLIGSAFDDVLTASDVFLSTLRGGAGADQLNADAALGARVSYAGSPAGVTLGLTAAGGTGLGGDAEGDTLTGFFSGIVGSSGNDSITVDGLDGALIDGGAGADTIVCGTGDETVVYDPADLVVDFGAGSAGRLTTTQSIDFAIGPTITSLGTLVLPDDAAVTATVTSDQIAAAAVTLDLGFGSLPTLFVDPAGADPLTSAAVVSASGGFVHQSTLDLGAGRVYEVYTTAGALLAVNTRIASGAPGSGNVN